MTVTLSPRYSGLLILLSLTLFFIMQVAAMERPSEAQVARQLRAKRHHHHRNARRQHRQVTRYPTQHPTPQPTSGNQDVQASGGNASGEYEFDPQDPTDQPNPVSGDDANARNGYDIDFIFDGVDSKYRSAFELARQRWTSVITADLPSEITLVAGSWCDYQLNSPIKVDDLLIAVKIRDIDGAGGVLGRAGPVSLRTEILLETHELTRELG
jgi:hypothetical protein